MSPTVLSAAVLSNLVFLVLAVAAIGSGFVFTGIALTSMLLLFWLALALRHTFTIGAWIIYPLGGKMLAYLVWLGAATAWSVIPHASWLAAWVFAGLPIAYFAWGMTPQPEKIWSDLRGILLMAGPAFAAWGLAQVLTGYGYGYPVGPLVDKNAYAALLNLFWFMAGSRFIATVHDRGLSWHMLLQGLGLLLMAMAFFAAESRGATLVWLMLMPLLLWGGYRTTGHLRPILVVLGIALTGYLSAAGALGVNVAHRTMNLEQDASANARLLMWKSALQIAQDHPVVGTGWGTFAAQYPAYRDPRENTTAGVYAHNDYLQIAAEGGIPGVVLLVSILAGLVLQLRRILILKRDFLALEASGLILGALALFIHATVNFIFYFAFMNILCGLFIARAVQLMQPAGVGCMALAGTKRIGRATRMMVAGILALLVAGPLSLQLLSQTTLQGSQPGLALLRTAWPATNAYDIAKFIAALQPHSSVAQEVLLRASENALRNSEGISMEGIDFQRELLEETLARYELILRQTGGAPAYGVREANTLIQYRELAGANRAMRRAHEILTRNLQVNPFHADSMIALSRLRVAAGQPDEAQHVLATFMRHVLSRRDQQLIAIEMLRQRAAPRQIAELDTLEKQLRNVRSDSETGKPMIWRDEFFENIDERLEDIARDF